MAQNPQIQRNLVEHLRFQAIESIWQMNSFSNPMETWRNRITTLLGDAPTADTILSLGDNLSDIFRLTGEAGREQRMLTSGGHGWEALVCWYMNLCMIGSRSVVIKRKISLIPTCVGDAMTIVYHNSPTNTESDLVCLSFPNVPAVTDNLTNDQLGNFKRQLDQVAVDNLDELVVGNIQCKTNWKDNAQVPMLWDMIYRSNGFNDEGIHVGQNNFSITDFNDFSYSFMTVPTGGDPTPNTMPVRRVTGLSGGNYWGQPTRANVALSIREIFNRNFATGQNNNLRNDITTALFNFNTNFDYFGIEI